MKNLIYLSSLVLLCSCATKKLSIKLLDSTSVQKQEVKTKEVEKSIDTSKSVSKAVSYVSEDSTSITTIHADSGTINVNTGAISGIDLTYSKVQKHKSNSIFEKDTSQSMGVSNYILKSTESIKEDSMAVHSATLNKVSIPDDSVQNGIVGVIVAGFVAIVLIVFLIVWLFKRSRTAKR